MADLRSAPPPPVVRAVSVAIVGLGALGVVAIFTHLPNFHLDAEVQGALGAPAVFSAGLLFAAAILALLCRGTTTGSGRWLALGALFVFMALDELLTFHETLERELVVDWQTLYLPLILVAAFIWLRVLQATSAFAGARLLWVAGAVAWGLSQLLEQIAWGPGDELIRGGRFMTTGEEILEMTGSALFVWALLILLAHLRGGQPAPGPVADP